MTAGRMPAHASRPRKKMGYELLPRNEIRAKVAMTWRRQTAPFEKAKSSQGNGKMPPPWRRLGAATICTSLLTNNTIAFSGRASACHPCGDGRPSTLHVLTTSSSVILAARKRKRRKSSDTNKGSDEQNNEANSYESADLDNALFSTSSSKYQPNRRERMELILERDGYDCVWCRVPLNIDTATTDHLLPRIKGGPSWLENELASCRKCNKMRGHIMPLDWLDECRRERGWNSNNEAIVRGLHAFDKAIMREGGQRRVRPYLARQLRLLEKRDG